MVHQSCLYTDKSPGGDPGTWGLGLSICLDLPNDSPNQKEYEYLALES